MLRAFWLKLKHTRFFKKKRQVRRNPLNENIFEFWGRIDETI